MKNIIETKTFVIFVRKKNESDKVRDHCHLTGQYRGPAHNNGKIDVTQKQSTFIPSVFHNFSKYGCRLFFKKPVDIKNVKVNFDIRTKTNEGIYFSDLWFY